MKSVTVKTKKGVLLLKVIHRKSGVYDLTKRPGMDNVVVEVRDDRGHKVVFGDRGK